MRRIGAGKLELLPRFTVSDLDQIAALYTPGVGYLVSEIVARPEALGELDLTPDLVRTLVKVRR
jgi:malic enzyme